MKETELYESVRGYFTTLGFTVRAEVKDIDICAVKDDLLVGIELKRNFSTDLLIQAVLRQKVCDLVYIAVPKPKRVKKDRSFRSMLHMLSRLELGLLYVDIVTGSVVEVLEPTFYDLDKARKTMMKTRRSILNEIKRRTLDGNVGGSSKTRLLTAYREESLKTVALVRHKGVISPKDLKEINIRPGLLNNNFYGWFQKLERGRYVLDEKKRADYAEYEVYIEGFQEVFRVADDTARALSETSEGEEETVLPEGVILSSDALPVKKRRKEATSEPAREKAGEKDASVRKPAMGPMGPRVKKTAKEEEGKAVPQEGSPRTKKASMTTKTGKMEKAQKALMSEKPPRAANTANSDKSAKNEKQGRSAVTVKNQKPVRSAVSDNHEEPARSAAPLETSHEGPVRRKRKTGITAEGGEE